MKHGISDEPLFWAPFSGGGMLAAMLVPIHIVLFWILIPMGTIKADGLAELVQHPIARVYLFVFVSGCLLHWAHRFRYALLDLGITGFRTGIAVLCYGAAIAGSVWGGMVFFGS